MAVIAIVQSIATMQTVVDHAVWAARELDSRICLVAIAPEPLIDTALEFEAYQRLDTQHDMLTELISVERDVSGPDTEWAVGLAQSAAKTARAAGAATISTEIVDMSVRSFLESNVDSTDLVVIPREILDREQSPILNVHRRMVLAVPDFLTTPETWLMAYNGIGRAIEFMTNTGFLRGASGTAILAGGDGQMKLHFRDAMEHLRDVGYDPTTYELRGDAEDVVAAVVTVTSPSLLIASVAGHDRMRPRIGRSVVPRYVREFAGPILLAID